MNDRKTFTDLGVEESLADALAEQDINHPFPIQELTLPLALKGADLIGQARTGTGKTLAFGLPLLQRIDPSKNVTQALVIVPTRELCIQVSEDLTVGAARGVTVQSVYGGVGYDEQIDALTSGVHVVVGTPGRTLDHKQRGNLDVSNVHVVVLDEADEMLDMGFLPDVERLLVDVPEERQTLLFSATMPTAIVKLARRFMQHPTFMRADAEERDTAPTVDQHFFLVHRMDKPRVLARILQTPDRGGAFVFTRTKNMADRLVRELDDLGVSAIAVHGDLRQSTREKNLDRFRDGKADVLVATEVAARGLDVTNVTHVINYDCPDDDKMYLHRIGRTARAGAEGVAITFAEFNEIDRVNVIRKALGAESEIAEIFSTSDELTERFGLPDATPWDKFARSSSRSSSGGSRRKSSTDGRPKSKRSSEGPSSQRPKRDASPRSGPRDREDRGDQPDHGDDRADSSSSRTRTRTRVRVREDADRTTAPENRAGASDAAQKSTTKNDSPGRKRSDASSGNANGRTRARKRASSVPARHQANERSDPPEPRQGSGRSSKGSDRSSGGNDRGGRKPSTARSSRNGNSGSDGSENGQRGRTTRRGADARGKGTPRPRRRVQVEHLP